MWNIYLSRNINPPFYNFSRNETKEIRRGYNTSKKNQFMRIGKMYVRRFEIKVDFQVATKKKREENAVLSAQRACVWTFRLSFRVYKTGKITVFFEFWPMTEISRWDIIKVRNNDVRNFGSRTVISTRESKIVENKYNLREFIIFRT